MVERGWLFTSYWFIVTVVLYIAVGACWIPVVLLQYHMAQLARDASSYAALGQKFKRAFYWWVLLGILAFAMVLALYALMIFKPGL